MNKVLLIGRLTKDPDVRYSNTANGQMAVARYTLAVDRRYKKDGDQQTADFINCVAFGKTAEFTQKYLYKGRKIAVEGRIQTGSYTKQDGSKVYTTDVIAEACEFAESKGPNQQQTTQQQQPPNDDFYPMTDEATDDDLPF